MCRGEPGDEATQHHMRWLSCLSPSLTADYETVGGVAHAEMMERTNLVAMVAGGVGPKFPDRNGNGGRGGEAVEYNLHDYIQNHNSLGCKQPSDLASC